MAPAMTPSLVQSLPRSRTVLSFLLLILIYSSNNPIKLFSGKNKWQARRDSNPQRPDLESGALSIRATGLFSHNDAGILQVMLTVKLLCFPVNLVDPAEFAIFSQFKTILHSPFVLCCGVISLFTFRTG